MALFNSGASMHNDEGLTKVDVFEVPYAVTDYAKAAELITARAESRTGFSVFALPVHGVVERRRDAKFADAIDSASLIVPDGQPIRWVMNWFHSTNLKDRVYGPELLRQVLARPRSSELRVFVYGGRTIQVQRAFVEYIERNFPNVTVCGAYRENSPDIQTLAATTVQAANPHLVVVGLGCPKQEKWIANNQTQIDAVLMGVGAAFGFFSGDQKSAPKWMQDRGLEWLFRLSKEPARLWRRYFYTNSVFVLLVVRECVSRGFSKLLKYRD